MRNYEEEMDMVIDALRMAELMLIALPDNSLDELEKTVRAADSMAFIMVAPLELDATTKRLKDQKQVLKWARNTISVYKSMEEE